ncbi:MAG: hypothetical protein NTV07_01655, partial [Candidatus Omnitrophica bacterium]|nr:hypothetical protein [Candidatus Omnitrophota bacterium]
SLFDFNFHITSNAILFFVISAIGLCAAGSRVEGSMDKSLLPMTRAIPVKNIFVKIVLFMMLLCGLIYAVWFIVRPYTAYRLIYKKNPALVELNRARMVLPLSDKCHFALAEFFTAHAAGDKKDEYVRLAREEIKTAIRLNPWYEYYQTYLEWIDKTFAE